MSNQIIKKGVPITFLGHACFKLLSPHGTSILIDPWVKGNPQAPQGAENVGSLHYILVSHGHGDHLGDTIELAQKTGAHVIAMPEIAHYLIQKGLNPEKIVGMNKGGSVIVADILVLLGYYLFYLVLRENTYASRVVEVETEQKVISSGPYALVRHPMYVAILLMFAISPLALGSLWGMLPMILMPIILVLRILNEEKVLREGLEGYKEYTHKVKWRLIPGIW